MITGKIMDGYSSIDGCFKYSDPDSTIDCYTINRNKIQKSLSSNDWELKTNGIYILIGEQNNKTMAYIGQAVLGKDGDSVIRRLIQHIDATEEKYYPYWEQAIIFVCKNSEPNLMWDTSIIDDLEALLIRDTQHQYSWNSREESLKNPMSIERARSHSKKILSIKDYIKELGLTFFDEIDETTINENSSFEEKQNVLVKQILDKTVDLATINLEPRARIPEYTTPEKVVNDMLDKLPWDTFDYNTTFFDPACKGGEFLALLHDRLINILEKDNHFSRFNGIEKFIKIHEHIVNNMIYGVAIGDNSFKASKERVYNCEHIIKANHEYIELLAEKRSYIAEKLVEKLLGEKEMKFDVVLGNPPYNDTDETGSSKSINTYFVELATTISNRFVLFIMPDRWFVSPDKLNSECRKSLIGKIRYMRDYDTNDLPFKGVNIAGGVSYWLYDSEYNGDMIYEDNRGSINTRHNERFMIKTTQSNILYNHVKVTTEKYMDADFISTLFFGLKRNSCGSKTRSNENNIKIISSGDDSYISLNEVPKNREYVQFYKVVIPYSAMNPKPFILKPDEICTLTYIIVRFFKTYEEASNCKKYFETNFFKILFNGLKTKLGSTKENFSCVPLQDFASNSDIDWTKSISEIDKQLYAKYSLSEEEIKYIEDTIKPMDNTSKPQSSLTNQAIQANYINKIASSLVPNTI